MLAVSAMRNTKKLTFSAILSALAVAIMYVGSVLDVLDMSTAAIASLCVMVVLTELGTKYAFMTFACTGVLSVLLVPSKTAALMFVGFLGFYPMAKRFFEQKFMGPLCLVLKFALLNVCTVAIAMFAFFVMKVQFEEANWFLILLLVLCNIVFAVYDYAISNLLRAYIFVWRKKLKIKF